MDRVISKDEEEEEATRDGNKRETGQCNLEVFTEECELESCM